MFVEPERVKGKLPAGERRCRNVMPDERVRTNESGA
jgi:hypothetical protein